MDRKQPGRRRRPRPFRTTSSPLNSSRVSRAECRFHLRPLLPRLGDAGGIVTSHRRGSADCVLDVFSGRNAHVDGVRGDGRVSVTALPLLCSIRSCDSVPPPFG